MNHQSYNYNTEDRVSHALNIARDFGQYDGAHHKTWCIDQIVRALTGCPIEKQEVTSTSQLPSYSYECQGESEEYKKFVQEHNSGDDGPDTYYWDTGIAP